MLASVSIQNFFLGFLKLHRQLRQILFPCLALYSSLYKLKALLIMELIIPHSSGSEDKASACNVGDLGLIPGLGRSPGEGNGNPLQYSCLENPMDKRSLAGYSPWGHKESDRSEQLHFTSTNLNLTLVRVT